MWPGAWERRAVRLLSVAPGAGAGRTGRRLLYTAPPRASCAQSPHATLCQEDAGVLLPQACPGRCQGPRFIRAPGLRKPLKEGLFAAHFPPCTRDRRFPGATHLLTAGVGLGSLFCHLPVSPIWQGTLPPVAQLPRGCSAPLTAAPRPPSGSLSARPCSSGPKLQAPAFPTDFLSDFYQQLKVYQVHKEEGQVFFSFYNLSSSFAYFEVMVSGA